MRLKHKSNVASAVGGQCGLVHVRNIGAIHYDVALIGMVEAADDVQQGALARSALAADDHARALRDRQIQAAQDCQLLAAADK